MLEDKVFCRNCSEFFIKGTGHLLYCADCASKGEDAKHAICDECHKDLLAKGLIKNVTYNKGDLSPDLMEKLR